MKIIYLKINRYMMMMWAICGVHDKSFIERDIYGKIRTMSNESYRGKFDVDSFIEKYLNKRHELE
jgi:hypothetical protein